LVASEASATAARAAKRATARILGRFLQKPTESTSLAFISFSQLFLLLSTFPRVRAHLVDCRSLAYRRRGNILVRGLAVK
jgi:hypothetical protein